MYFPYLRGKQFELIALRELVGLPLDSEKIVPIVEPVKRGLKTVSTALKALKPLDVKIQLIVNPQVGELIGRTEDIIEFISNQLDDGIDNIIPTFIIHSDNDVTLLQNTIQDEGYDHSGYALVHLSPIRRQEELTLITRSSQCLYNTIHINHVFALRRKFDSKVILADYFKKQRVNADYAIDVDEAFSSDCFFYDQEGFDAFSDFQGVGADWIEGGRLPSAVAIHLTYKDPGQDEIRIRHFVSDTNDDSLDVAGKFHEAVTKLVHFCDSMGFDSVAIDAFRDLHSRQAFPGLGSIKKLSIMHHIELMQGLI